MSCYSQCSLDGYLKVDLKGNVTADIRNPGDKDKFNNMNCFNKYNSYTNSNNLPVFVRALDKIV